MTETFPQFETGDLLLVVDVQKDFCPGGALPIAGGDQVVPVVNSWISSANEAGVPIYFSRDWHPEVHLSFDTQGGPWPEHCRQDTLGADFHDDLLVPEDAVIVTKGTRFDQDQNSAFDQTGLAGWLKKQMVKRIFVAGLALDVCVLATVMDALAEGFDCQLIAPASRPVTTEGGEKALRQMKEAGARIIHLH